MKLSLSNFLTQIRNIVMGGGFEKDGKTVRNDAGFQVDQSLSLATITNATEFPAITDSTGGTASTTFAAVPAGGTGAAAGGWDTAGHRDTAIASINNNFAQIAKQLNALANVYGTTDSAKIPTYIVASGTNPAVGTVSFMIPRDYDEATDIFAVRFAIYLANADAGITLTGTPTTFIANVATDGTLVSATLAGKTSAAALSTTEQIVTLAFKGLGLKRDSILAVKLAIAGTTTGNTNIVGLQSHFHSTLVSYNETDGVNALTGNLLR